MRDTLSFYDKMQKLKTGKNSCWIIIYEGELISNRKRSKLGFASETSARNFLAYHISNWSWNATSRENALHDIEELELIGALEFREVVV